MKSREWEVMPLEGNKESTVVIVGANTTVPSPDIPIRISVIILLEIWRFYNAHCLHFWQFANGLPEQHCFPLQIFLSVLAK